MAFLKGLPYGLATALLIGPVLFTLLKAALEYGFKGGFLVALGIIIGDIIAVVLCMKGLLAAFDSYMSNETLAIIAGTILILLGLKYILKPNMNLAQEGKLSKASLAGLFFAGFAVNFLNPFVFVVWLALSKKASTFGTEHQQWQFLAGVLVGIFITDILKSVFAPKLRRFLSPTTLKKVYTGIGVALIVFSIRAFAAAW